MGAIEVTDLAMAYGELKAVDGVSFEVAEGEFFGILGPNGAGKTTTLEMIEGLRKPDAGSIRVLGESPWPRNAAMLPRIGVQLQASSFFERLTAREQIHTFASLYGVSTARGDEWLERVGLVDKADTRVEDLSGGQTQRLSIACALVHDPGAGLPRRADRVARPPGPAQPLGPALRHQRGRSHRRPHHPLHGRGRGAVRPGRDHGPRPGSSSSTRRASWSRRWPRRPGSPPPTARPSRPVTRGRC